MESSDLEMAAIQRNENKPEDWLAFINRVKRESANYHHIVELYGKAASLISPDENRKNISYARLLVEFAKLQSMSSPDDARDTFRVARCNVKKFAIVYLAWAQFELSQGNRGKCKSLLNKGRMNAAEPIDILNQALHSCEQGNERLLDDETEELAFTGVLSEAGKSRLKLKIPTLQSDSELTQEKLMTGTDNSTGNQVLAIQGSECSEGLLVSSKQDNSGVISFKLSENSDRLHPRIRQKLSSSSSSSGEDTVTAPLHHICRPNIKSMSTCKPSTCVKATPDWKTVDSNSLSNSMNLSVRKSSARRGLKNNSLFLGPPMRGRHVSSLEDVKERNVEGEEQFEVDDMDDIKVLDYTSSLLVQDKVLSESKRDPVANIGNNKNTLSQVSLEKNVPDFRSTVLTLHDDFAKSALHNECHDNYSDIENQDPSKNKLDQNKVSIKQVPYCQALHGRHVDLYSQEKNNYDERYSKQTMHQNLKYPNQEGANYQDFASNMKDLAKREVTVNQVFPQVHTAIDNTSIFVNGKPYSKLGTIGRGGSSKVFRVFDGQHVCAVKYVSLEDADDVIIQSYINEISMLKRLQGSDHIIKLCDWEKKQNENSIVLVLECGSIDLAAFLRKNRSSFTQTELTACWKQMLEAVNVIHNQGIIHSDLKPANFLFVEGRLKLIDFGIAITIQADQTSIQRDTQVGTLNFMSPEAFQDISGSSQTNPTTGRSRPLTKIGRPSDVWSLGCILYNMVYGRTPFQHITNQAMKLQCIMDENYAIEFPPVDNQQLLDVLKGCLIRNPRERYTIPQLLKHRFLSLGKQDPNEEQLFNCLLELVQAQVNSPRSIRVASESICEQLRSGNKMDLSSVLARKRHLQKSMALRKPPEGLGVQELPQSHNSMDTSATSFAASNLRNAMLYSNKDNV